MSWGRARQSRSLPSRRGLLGLLAAGVAAPLVSACGDAGFRPLHGSAALVGGADQRLQQVEFAAIPGRVGQRIRNELIFGANGGADRVPPTMRLDVAIRESVTSALVRSDGETLSQIYNLEASFKLVNLADRKVIFEGQSFSRAAFDRNPSIFSNVRAREDAENRAARTISGDVKTRLAAFLSGRA